MHCPAEGFTARASETNGKVPRSVYARADAGAGSLPAAHPRDAGLPDCCPSAVLALKPRGPVSPKLTEAAFGGSQNVPGGSQAAPYPCLCRRWDTWRKRWCWN